MLQKILIVINKDEGSLGPSETFLHAHINGLPADIITLVGNPGYRCLDASTGEFLQSRSIMALAFRWLARKLGLTDVSQQDRKALRHFMRRNNVSAVLAEYGLTAVTVMDACQDAKVPLVAQFHGYDAYRKQLLEDNLGLYRQLFKKAAAIVAVSKHMQDQLLKLGARPESTFHNACGADLPPDLCANPERAGKKFIMVGRLVEKKAPFISIIAFSRVVSNIHDAQLDIIGDGPLRQACEQLCKGLGINDKVIFHGALPHKLVLQKMSQARCFIQHSVRAPDGDNEGTPVSVLEAMGLGLPVVSTRHGGIMDVIKDTNTGSLVNEYDVDSMGKEMIKYAHDAKSAQQIGANARAAVLMSWTNEKSVHRLWEIIENTISSR